MEHDGNPESEAQLKKLKLVRPLVTIMGVPRKLPYGVVQGGTLVIDQDSQQLKHYGDDQEKVSDDDLVNGGIYYISTNIYKEFERQQQVVEEDIKLQNMIDELDVVTQDLDQDLDIESCVPFDYTKIEPIELIG